mgnify:CR=1 FL=1
MKKLLSMAFCAAAMASFAADITLEDVGVTMVTLPAGQANTILAVSFKELETGADISISNLVRTTGLKAEDRLLLFSGTKDTYSSWKLDTDGGKWVAAEKTFTVNKDGTLVEGEGDSPTEQASIGTGLWIVRADPTDAAQIALYGAYVDPSAPEVKKDTWCLVGNPQQTTWTISTGDVGDRLVAVNEKGILRTYQYKSDGWGYVTYAEDGTPTRNVVNPTIEAGKGFWYRSATDKTALSF